VINLSVEIKKKNNATLALMLYSLRSINPTHPNAKGRLFPVPNGTVAIGGGCGSLRSLTTPSNHPAVPSPPAT